MRGRTLAHFSLGYTKPLQYIMIQSNRVIG